MSHITGGTGEFGCVVKDRLTAEGMVIKCQTFADAKSVAVRFANEYVQHLRENHNLSTSFTPGQHPSKGDVPTVKVNSTDVFPGREDISAQDIYPVFAVDILVDVRFDDGSRNTFMDKTYIAGKIELA
jgi:hypothetical protein